MPKSTFNPLHQVTNRLLIDRTSFLWVRTWTFWFIFLYNPFHYIALSLHCLPLQAFFPNNQGLSKAMLEGKAIVGETDMLHTMQKDALHLAAKALDIFEATESTDIAQFIKKDFDRLYGPGWQCVVGTDFSSFVTHCHGCFIHFCVGSLAILLFRGAVNQAKEANLLPTFEALDA
ncbi:hypothetical protein Gogos_002681 [Gossypium gossypioides]|uniref:Dynein light chain n=1 Tax=Gossypium gossypioides TaxID=34282 RepID=A0A7J9CJN4_GOSGO|nr:hypothetical protein [Gossypium gossypioides]